MGACDGCLGIILMGIIAIPASLFQAIGVFTKDWVRATSCEELNYKPSCCNASADLSSGDPNCEGPYGLGDLHEGVFSMQLLAFVIVFTPVGCGLLDICCLSDDENASGGLIFLGGCCFLLYPVAGILNFIGCMIVVGVYSGQSFGKSFDFCLGGGLYVLILTVILIILLHLKHKRKAQAEKQRRGGYTTDR